MQMWKRIRELKCFWKNWHWMFQTDLNYIHAFGLQYSVGLVWGPKRGLSFFSLYFVKPQIIISSKFYYSEAKRVLGFRLDFGDKSNRTNIAVRIIMYYLTWRFQKKYQTSAQIQTQTSSFLPTTVVSKIIFGS